MSRPPTQRRKPPGDAEPDDALGTWPRERLLKMDQRFVDRVEHAFATGRETHAAAAATVRQNVSAR